MSLINIPIIKGENWISFPENSTNNLLTIFSKSGLGNVTIYKYDPLKQLKLDLAEEVDSLVDSTSTSSSTSSGFTLVDMTSYVEQGRGYHIIATNPGIITYTGVPYKTRMTFDKLRKSLIRGYNLVATDNNIIDLSRYDWCRIVDASTNFSATELVPNKAYWIFYPDDCSQQQSGLDALTKATIIGVIITGYVVFWDDIKKILKLETKIEKEERLESISKNRNKKLKLLV
jgi:hypothetical protein